MPWKVSGVVEQRQRFLREYETGEWTMTELCRAYEISRPTGYALWHRYGNEGEAGLEGEVCRSGPYFSVWADGTDSSGAFNPRNDL